jgi:restriction system-associated AAA family ATPase
VKLLRLKITDPNGFRSLQPGFEHYFRREWQLEEELKQPRGLAPFVCAGPNGSGKSNLLEVLAAIFFQLEVLRVRRSFLPEAFFYDEETNPTGIKDGEAAPDGFELEYWAPVLRLGADFPWMYLHVRITKDLGKSPRVEILTQGLNGELLVEEADIEDRDFLLPRYVIGYSSGENEILSLPFFKMRFIQYDEYWNALRNKLPYPGRPETRLAYFDSTVSQALLICNLLFDDETALARLRKDVGVKELREFRIIIRRSIPVSDEVVAQLGVLNQLLRRNDDSFDINLMNLLEAGSDSADRFNPIVTRLKRCATCHYTDAATDTLYLDYYVNEATRRAFSDNFDFAVNRSPIALFQAFQILLTLNLYSVSAALKSDLYKSDSHYVNETVPTLASDKRIMRFKFLKFAKEGVEKPVTLKSLSDGEHQLLHSLGLCLLFKNTNSLFLLDEPETHFNPEWRSSFISRLRECFADAYAPHEMLITTHSPFLISDSKPDRVLVFDKQDGKVHVEHPDFNTFGASVNKITLAIFGKRETIGGVAQFELERLRALFDPDNSPKELIDEIYRTMGDSVERTLLLKYILDRSEEKP